MWPIFYLLYSGSPSFLGESESHSVMSDSLQQHGVCSPWNSPGQNTVMGSHSLLQGIFPTQGSNPSPTFQADSFTAEPSGKPKNTGVGSLSLLRRIFPTHLIFLKELIYWSIITHLPLLLWRHSGIQSTHAPVCPRERIKFPYRDPASLYRVRRLSEHFYFKSKRIRRSTGNQLPPFHSLLLSCLVHLAHHTSLSLYLT